MKFWKKVLRSIWGVEQPSMEMAPPIDCDACRIARMNGGDACWEHHQVHPHAHTYKIGHEASWGSGLERDAPTPNRPSASSVF